MLKGHIIAYDQTNIISLVGGANGKLDANVMSLTGVLT
jgi:hypothetical protein